MAITLCYKHPLLINTLIGLFIFLQLSITNLVPLLFPSQKAKTKSALSMISRLRFSGAYLPCILYSGRNSVYLILFFTANSFAHLSIPFAPPEMISVVSFGIYFSRFLTASVLEPITAFYEPIMGSLLHYSTIRTYNKPIIGSFEVQFYERKAKTFVTTN